MVTDFFFQLNNKLYYGIGKSKSLPGILERNDYRHVALMVDEGVKKNVSYYEEIAALISKTATTLDTFVLRGTEEPDYQYLDEIVDQLRALPALNVIIAIGGGSCMDIAKAAAVLYTNAGKGIEYRGFDKAKNAGIDTILVPTTAGTGSEVTINAVFTDKGEMRKLGINGMHMNAKYAILDSKWIEHCPKSVLVSSAGDALTHTLESYMCKQATELTRMFSKKAFELIYNGLEKISNDSADLETLQRLLLGSYLAGAALFNSGSGISGAFSYPLGVHFKIPHGLCGAVFLADVVAYNVSKGYDGYAELYDLIETSADLSAAEKNERFCIKIKELLLSVGIPQYLDEYGVTMTQFEYIAALLIPMQGAFDQNPVSFSSDEDAKALLMKHIR